GVNRAAYKVAAFGVSAAYAGVAGSLLAINTAYVSPLSFPIQMSLYLIVGAVVGFFGSIWGAALGALLIQFLPDIVGLVSIVGTNGNLAVRDFLNAAGIPQVFSAAGATTLGRDYAKYPWTIGYLPPYAEEGKIYARQILATNANKAKIAVLYQSDDYGKDMLSGFRQGLGANHKLIV